MAVTELQREYLDAMGIQAWSLRHPEIDDVVPVVDVAEAVAATPIVAVETEAPVAETAVVGDDWQRLDYQVAQCTSCDLHQSRTQAVPGLGNRQADWMIVTDVPSVEEERQGEPLVGPPGDLLAAMLRAVGLQREDVFVTNIVKCRSQNRIARPDELLQCQGFLQRQIALLRPKVIFSLGNTAAQTLLNTSASVGQLLGESHVYSDTQIPVVVSYHPAYLLQSPKEKRRSWQALQRARQLVAESSPDHLIE